MRRFDGSPIRVKDIDKYLTKEEGVSKLSDAMLAALKKPLPPEAVSPHPTKSYLSTIKAIYVVERFNEVFGVGGWTVKNEVAEVGEEWVVVKSTFSAPEWGVVVQDIFGGNNNQDRGDAYKGACTDALTKIGSYLYVGMDVYKGLTDRKSVPVKGTVSADAPKKITKAQQTELGALIQKYKMDVEEVKSVANKRYGVTSSSDLSEAQATDFITLINNSGGSFMPFDLVPWEGK